MSPHHRLAAVLLLLAAALAAVALPASANTLDMFLYLPIVRTPPSNVQIATIFYDDLVSRVESDEYAEITNLGSAAVNDQTLRKGI